MSEIIGTLNGVPIVVNDIDIDAAVVLDPNNQDAIAFMNAIADDPNTYFCEAYS